MQRDDVYLIDMWRVLLREWRWFLAGLLLVLLCTAAFLHTTKPQWQANAWIQIGQVSDAPQGQDPKVEPPQRVIERLQLLPSQNAVLDSIGIGAGTPAGQLYRASMKLEAMYYAGPLVKLSVRAYSAQQAGELAKATVTWLQSVHRGMEAAPLQLAHARLDEIQRALQEATTERDRLQQSAAQSKDNVTAALLLSHSDQIRELQQARAELQIRLSSAYTYDTALMWPVYVPEYPVFPNPSLTWGLGLLLGLFLGTLVAIARNTLRRELPRA
ncbi:Wzz/FepE/Etk N-terminal domain-containing protein [Dyella acidiphila]|uniref:Lipopolysaccharide biosynthesis protein n=1 Tax=Dyella acidiphila TaxID=2775866 RepID=A0ABR9GCZ9_9GAMM|nr:Wzz/FepE/Etk N-terminal domain-containing protein [Dyella acidiphila]MBE1161903.1 lipopolysaccharide biosynthesis protein [Dyella acidiphila]